MNAGQRVKVAGKMGRVARVAQFRTRTPYLVTFDDGTEGTFAEGDVVVWPSTIECDRCKRPLILSRDGYALCVPCAHKVKWEG